MPPFSSHGLHSPNWAGSGPGSSEDLAPYPQGAEGYRERREYGTGNVPPGNGFRDPTPAPLERQLGYPNPPQTASLNPASGVGLAETVQSWAPNHQEMHGGRTSQLPLDHFHSFQDMPSDKADQANAFPAGTDQTHMPGPRAIIA